LYLKLGKPDEWSKEVLDRISAANKPWIMTLAIVNGELTIKE